MNFYPYIEREDVLEAIRLGGWLASERYVSLEPAARKFVVDMNHGTGMDRVFRQLAAGALVTIESDRYRIRRLLPPEST